MPFPFRAYFMPTEYSNYSIFYTSIFAALKQLSLQLYITCT